MKDLIAVQGMTSEQAGATVWWTMSGSVSLTRLREAWIGQGLPADWLPEAPSAEQKLGRAVATFTSQRVLARPLSRRGHYAIVVESVEDGGSDLTLHHQQTLAVKIVEGWPRFSEPCSLADAILQAFDAQDGLLNSNDIAEWLSESILRRRIYGTKLRPRGGLYYVLPAQMKLWRKICDVVAECKLGSCYTLPTLAGDDATRAVLDALTRDVGSDVETIQTQIAQGVGVRALRARVEDCNGLLARLAQYETLLGSALDAVREKVTVAQDAALLAAFQVESAAFADAQ